MSIRIVIEIQNPEELFDNEAPKIGRVLADLGLISRRKAILKGFTKNLYSGLEEKGVRVQIEAEDTLQAEKKSRRPLRLPGALHRFSKR
ncbi:MAG: hypothetical protein JRG96_05285 [Deltaproteobacteria bacterium]|nr:hypothetical protein [Deltaproteobacteria bacterium]MBW2416981.1 hypothetical protein [Deltaproteobacteria bacterium]